MTEQNRHDEPTDKTDHDAQRKFAIDVVRRLRAAGFESVFAGGCVRDQMLEIEPKDYDVATDATPDQVREIFGRRRTLAVGAAFGVIVVLGRKHQGQVEVATFRSDAEYSDGRRPDAVVFTDAQSDAKRRDFTINGMFYDPLDDRTIDYVGGVEDLDRGVIRAIGDPHERLAEDYLRMLRAVRFTARFGFSLEDQTRHAVEANAPRIVSVSAERILNELERMLLHSGRRQAVELLLETGLMRHILPELATESDNVESFGSTLEILDRLTCETPPPAIAALLLGRLQAGDVEPLGRRLKMSNHDIARTKWLVENATQLRTARRMPHSQLQPILIHDGIEELLQLFAAIEGAAQSIDTVRMVRGQLARDRSDLDPEPLIDGGDLKRLGLKPGPLFREILTTIRNDQLDRVLTTKAAAIAKALRMAGM